jgi:hypothetical protein
VAAALVLLVLPLLAYAGLCGWYWVHQRAVVFAPGGLDVTPEQAGLAGFSVVQLRTEDGERLVGWWLPPPRPQAGVVLFLHGTPGTLRDTVWRLPALQQAGFGVLAIDYRGYGGSTGAPTELGMRADARAAFDFTRAEAPGARIAVFAESLGTGVAVALARDRPVAGVLLNAPYASVRRLFEGRGPPLPYRWLMADPFDSEAMIGEVTAPVMILHGTADRNIPIDEGRRLFAAANEPKRMIEVEGAGHLGAWDGGGSKPALAALAAWTRRDQ